MSKPPNTVENPNSFLGFGYPDNIFAFLKRNLKGNRKEKLAAIFLTGETIFVQKRLKTFQLSKPSILSEFQTPS
jgi:hypothetical protein